MWVGFFFFIICFLFFILFGFFFQAEGGIRDAQEFRGVGDVYKRQPRPECTIQPGVTQGLFFWGGGSPWEPASYTHLTLPPILRV